ncbi:hypothetical protein Atc_0505 [Acidithiobacillus caldus SM-1]|uniref:Uncharacterized protein n=1 Tax=Acidithiobacillus caldus (strain SM-1) TaxID=990288 RepID=F9ZT04_ACICS|nr:hypothetical protein Atc_0505 [Acidithiobacillus caldus SM-1]
MFMDSFSLESKHLQNQGWFILDCARGLWINA